MLSKLSLRIISNSSSSRSENADWSLCEQQPMIPSKCLLISSQTASSKALKNPSSDHFKQQPLMLQNAGWSSPNSSLSRSKTQADPFQTVASLKSPLLRVDLSAPKKSYILSVSSKKFPPLLVSFPSFFFLKSSDSKAIFPISSKLKNQGIFPRD